MPTDVPASENSADSGGPTSAPQPVSAAQTIAAGYATEGVGLILGAVMVDGHTDPDAKVTIPLSMVNRHGLIAGATGTGKTKTLQVFAELLSANGVPVVMADVKGDLSGLSQPGEASEKIDARARDVGVEWSAQATPVEFWSLGTEGVGIPLRAHVSSFGPILLAKVLGLNDTQESTLGLVFHWADEQGLELYDLKDLRSVLQYLTSEEGKDDLKGIGGVSSQTAGVILRALINLENAGGDTFFGDPELNPADLRRVVDGKGVVNLIELGAHATQPTLFSTFLMWMLAELFQDLPEIGDVEKPEVVFIFDEAHLLFADASDAFLDQVEQTVKLIRSKGVGIYFCTQLPTDVPNAVLSQLGARIQHALRAFTPDDQKALARTVKTYPTSEVYKLDQALTSAGTGEAIITVLSERGAPTPVAWTLMVPPRSLMKSIGDDAMRSAAKASARWADYGTTMDPQSAFEKLEAKAQQAQEAKEAAATQARGPEEAQAPDSGGRGRQQEHEPGLVGRALANPAVRSFLRSAASAAGREISRSLFGTRRRR